MPQIKRAKVEIEIRLLTGSANARAIFEIPSSPEMDATAFFVELQRRLSEWMLESRRMRRSRQKGS